MIECLASLQCITDSTHFKCIFDSLDSFNERYFIHSIQFDYLPDYNGYDPSQTLEYDRFLLLLEFSMNSLNLVSIAKDVRNTFFKK